MGGRCWEKIQESEGCMQKRLRSGATPRALQSRVIRTFVSDGVPIISEATRLQRLLQTERGH